MEHPIVITLSHDGTTSMIYHPDKQSDLAEALSKALGQTVEVQRGGHVLPVNPIKRRAFFAIRKVFGGSGRLSDWTRSWRGPWVVIRADNGQPLEGTFPTHAAAVEVEVAYIQKEMI